MVCTDGRNTSNDVSAGALDDVEEDEEEATRLVRPALGRGFAPAQLALALAGSLEMVLHR